MLCAVYELRRKGPITGSVYRKLNMVLKKSLNNSRMPQTCAQNPNKVNRNLPMQIRMKPPKKNALPLIFPCFVKKLKVF